MLFTSKRSGENFAKDPAVVNFKGKYYMYYSALPTEEEKQGGSCLEVGIAISEDMENWEDVAIVKRTQDCTKTGIGAPAAIVLRGKVHLFYQVYGTGEKDCICHAVSDDGINFTENPTNPIYKPSNDWCVGRAIDADVCEFDGKLFLYIATRDHQMKVQKIGGAYADINSDYSRDCWKQITSQAILTPEFKWEGECIEAPATIVDRNKIYMFYGGSYNCMPQQIGCAVSYDGKYFEKCFTEPFIPCGKEGEWNSDESGHPYAFRDDDGRSYLFYQGHSKNGWYLSKTEIFFDDNGVHL